MLDEDNGPRHAGNVPGVHGSTVVNANTTTGEVSYNPPHYVMGQFSRFIRPGAKRIACTSTSDDFIATAALNTDGKNRAVVVLNLTEPPDLHARVAAGQFREIPVPAERDHHVHPAAGGVIPAIAVLFARPEENIHHIPQILLVGQGIHRLGGELHHGFETGGEFGKERHPRHGIECIASQQRIQRDARLMRGNALPETRGKMRMLSHGIVFPERELVEVGLRDRTAADDHGIGGKIAQPLAALAHETCNPAHRVKMRKRIDEPE